MCSWIFHVCALENVTPHEAKILAGGDNWVVIWLSARQCLHLSKENATHLFTASMRSSPKNEDDPANNITRPSIFHHFRQTNSVKVISCKMPNSKKKLSRYRKKFTMHAATRPLAVCRNMLAAEAKFSTIE